MTAVQPHIRNLWGFVYAPHRGRNQFLRSLIVEPNALRIFRLHPESRWHPVQQWLDIKRPNPSAVFGPSRRRTPFQKTAESRIDHENHHFANWLADGRIFHSWWSLHYKIGLSSDPYSLPDTLALNAPAPTLFTSDENVPFRIRRPLVAKGERRRGAIFAHLLASSDYQASFELYNSLLNDWSRGT